jgi:hypothetical protein
MSGNYSSNQDDTTKQLKQHTYWSLRNIARLLHEAEQPEPYETGEHVKSCDFDNRNIWKQQLMSSPDGTLRSCWSNWLDKIKDRVSRK